MKRRPYTFLGMLAIVFWSTTVSFARTLSEQLGPVRAACCIYLVGGVISCLLVYSRKGQVRLLGALGRRYWLGCGALFVLYTLCLYLAISTSTDRQQVLGVSLVNYLWPSLTLLLAAPILKQEAGFPLRLLGITVAGAGVSLALVGGGELTWAGFLSGSRGGASYVLALVAAFLWALYSTLGRRWAGDGGGNAVPLFILATGVALLLPGIASPGAVTWTGRAVLELLYMAVAPTSLAYISWDLAVRKGDIVLVASLANLTPLLSVVASSLFLGVAVGVQLWVACILVVAGAVICKAAGRARSGDRSEPVF